MKKKITFITPEIFRVDFPDGKSYEYRKKLPNTKHLVGLLHRDPSEGPAAHSVRDSDGAILDEYRIDHILHRLDGPAVECIPKRPSEQQEFCMFWGYPIPEEWTKPGGLTVDSILIHPNQDARAQGIKAYGVKKFVNDATSEIIDIDQGEKLSRVLIAIKSGEKFLLCTDGSTKEVYCLRVLDEVTNCNEAFTSLSESGLLYSDCIGEG